jgi:hypothetical protein
MTHIHIQLPANNPTYNKYRILDPIAHCSKELPHIHITTGETINPHANIQILHGMLDPYYYRNIEQLAKHMPIIWAVDDYMLDLPTTNPNYHHIGRTEIEVMRQCLELSTAILATTTHLGYAYGHIQKTFIAPNLVTTPDEPPTIPTKPRYGWLAGNSHYDDATIIQHLPAQYPDKEFLFFSCLPETLTTYHRNPGSNHINIAPTLKNVGYLPTQPLEHYQLFVPQLALTAGLAPLQATFFNACKSNLKWLEYSCLGIPTLASNVTPYKESIQHGVTGYLIENTPEAWTETINNIDPQVGINAYHEIKTKWSWSSPAKNIWLEFFTLISKLA